jgi:hypothetical protein
MILHIFIHIIIACQSLAKWLPQLIDFFWFWMDGQATWRQPLLAHAGYWTKKGGDA